MVFRVLARLFAFVLLTSGVSLGATSMGASTAWAHQDGCHRWHSCPSDSGSYICGDLGYDDECPAGGGASVEEIPEPEPVYDFEPPRRPRLTSISSRAGGLVRIAVQAEAGSRLVVRTAGRTVAAMTATGASQYLTFRAGDGTHTYRATATDSSDNQSAVGSVTVRADATPPTAAVDLGQATADDARSDFSLTTDAGSHYRMLVDGRPDGQGVVDFDGIIERVLNLANGRHRVVVVLTDRVGNQRVVNREFRVAVPALDVDLTPLSDAQDATQRFRVTGTPGARATVTIPGASSMSVRLDSNGLGETAFDLEDGTYRAPVATVVDLHGRRGTSQLARVVVDTSAPVLRASSRTDSSTVGRLALVIAAEQGSDIAWTVKDATGRTVRSAGYTSGTRAKNLMWDLDEGKYEVEVSATDQSGNRSSRAFAARVAADPLTLDDIVIAVVTIAVLVLLVLLVGWLLWRNRHKRAQRRQARAQRAADETLERQFTAAKGLYDARARQYAAETARHHQADAAWLERREQLATLRQLASSASATAVPGFAELKLKPGEGVFTTVPGALVDMRSRKNTAYPAVLDDGTITITTARVVFNGSKKREWAWDKLETVTHVGDDRTMMKVSNRKTLSGISYSNPQITRTYLDVAIADANGSRHRVVEALGDQLHRHEEHRPQPPAPLGPPPTRPAPADLQLSR